MPGSLRIIRKPTSELREDDYTSLGLVDLASQGYRFEGDEEFLRQQARAEFAYKPENINFFALNSEGRAVGSLTIAPWTKGDGKRGDNFWNKLREVNPALQQQAIEESQTVVNVPGIVVLPENRGQGIAKKLLKAFLTSQDSKFSFLMGQSGSPAAVIAWAKALEEHGFRTFYGDAEVTPGKIQNHTKDHEAILQAYFAARPDEGEVDTNGVRYLKPTVIVPPDERELDISSYPDHIREVFISLIEAQKVAGKEKTAVKTILSIKGELLKS